MKVECPRCKTSFKKKFATNRDGEVICPKCKLVVNTSNTTEVKKEPK